MDPLTHSMVGGFSAKALQVPKRTFWIYLFLGIAPDLDFIANLFGSWAAPFQHRGFTHSIFGVVCQALGYAYLFKKWDREPYWIRFRFYLVPLGLHVFCDFLTGYGLPLWSPFSFREVSGDLAVNLSVIPILFMGLGWMMMSLNWRGEQRAVRFVVACWGLYFALALTGKAMARQTIEKTEKHAHLLPHPINPFEWRAVATKKDKNLYYEYKVDLLKGTAQLKQSYPMPAAYFPVDASRQAGEVAKFLKNNRWPVARIRENVNGWDVEWGTLIFSLIGTVRSKVLVQVDRRGRILSEKKTYGFWTP